MTAALGLATDPSDWVSPGNSTVSSGGDPRDFRERGEAWWRREDTLGDVDRDDTSPPDRATSLRAVDQTARRRLLFLEEEVTFLADRVAHLESHRPAESPVTLVAFTSANVASRRVDANPSTAAKTAANPSSFEDVEKSGSAASTPSARARAASTDDHLSLTISDVSNLSACSSFDSAAFPFSASPSRASAESLPVTPSPSAERLTLDARANDFDFDPLRVHRARGRRLLHPLSDRDEIAERWRRRFAGVFRRWIIVRHRVRMHRGGGGGSRVDGSRASVSRVPGGTSRGQTRTREAQKPRGVLRGVACETLLSALGLVLRYRASTRRFESRPRAPLRALASRGV